MKCTALDQELLYLSCAQKVALDRVARLGESSKTRLTNLPSGNGHLNAEVDKG